MAVKKVTKKRVTKEKSTVKTKNTKETLQTKKYVFFILFTLLIFLVFNLLKPYFVVIIMSMILAYILYPMYRTIRKKVPNRNLSAGITVLAFIIIILIPIIILSTLLYFEITDSIDYIKNNRDNIEMIFNCITYEQADLVDNSLCYKINDYKKNLELFNIENSIISGAKDLGEYISSKLYSVLRTITSKIIEFAMMIFIIFFLIRDGRKLMDKIKGVLNLKIGHERKILKSLNDTTFAVIYGVLSVALIQGILAGIGAYLIAGLSQGILITVLVFFFAMIPFFGSGIVWIPVSLFVILQGIITGNDVMIYRGLGYFLWGALVVSLIDNFLKPKIIGERANIHPLVVFFGIFGGLKFFGVFGIIIGPIVLSLLVTFIKLYEIEILRK